MFALPRKRSIYHQWINKSTFTDKSLIILNSRVEFNDQSSASGITYLLLLSLLWLVRADWAHRRRLHALGELFYFNCAPPLLFLHWTKPWIRHYLQSPGNSVLIVAFGDIEWSRAIAVFLYLFPSAQRLVCGLLSLLKPVWLPEISKELTILVLNGSGKL